MPSAEVVLGQTFAAHGFGLIERGALKVARRQSTELVENREIRHSADFAILGGDTAQAALAQRRRQQADAARIGDRCLAIAAQSDRL